jgi:hypothetical protein
MVLTQLPLKLSEKAAVDKRRIKKYVSFSESLVIVLLIRTVALKSACIIPDVDDATRPLFNILSSGTRSAGKGLLYPVIPAIISIKIRRRTMSNINQANTVPD